MRFSLQTWTAFVSALVFVAMAALLSLVPVPFVVWAPGQAYDVLGDGDRALIQVRGVPTYPTEGSLDLTTVSVTRADARLSLPEALVSFFLPDRDTLPRNAVYRPGTSAEQVEVTEQRQMSDSKTDAVVAALRQAEVPVQELPMIEAVTLDGPSTGRLLPGDLVTRVDGEKVATAAEIRGIVRSHRVGERVDFTVLRGGTTVKVGVATGPSNENASVPVIGVTFGVGYHHAADVDFGIDQSIGGPSAGLVFSLGVYDKITPGPLTGNHVIAGTGTITADGQVGPIGGTREKLRSAQNRGAQLFLVPDRNCADLAGVDTPVPVVKVSSLSDAVTAVELFRNDPNAPGLDRCLP